MGKTYEYIQYFHRYDKCRGTTAKHANVQTGFFSDNSVQHASRVKPSGSLIYHPTALERQDRGESIANIRKRVTAYPDTYTCAAHGTVPVDVWQVYYANEGGPTTGWPATNWELDMRTKIKDLSVNLGQSVFEYRETASLFKRGASAVYDAWRCAKSLGTKRRACSKLKKRFKNLDIHSVASAELTIAFGIAPLLGDIHASLEQLQTALSKPLIRRMVVTKSARADVVTSYGDQSGKAHWKLTRSNRAVVYVRLNPNHCDFTMGNPLEVAWELVPFSFVVDWMIPVGDYLSALDALKGVDSITGTLTEKLYRTGRDDRLGYHSGNPAWPMDFVQQVGRAHRVYHEREVLSSIPLPRVPTWNPSKSWKSVMHGAALLDVVHQSSRRSSRGGRASYASPNRF